LYYNKIKKALERLEIAVIGDHWGVGPFTDGARPGRKPLGIFLELSAGKTAGDRVPPQGAREWNAYMSRN
jgi:hypothetical protein